MSEERPKQPSDQRPPRYGSARKEHGQPGSAGFWKRIAGALNTEEAGQPPPLRQVTPAARREAATPEAVGSQTSESPPPPFSEPSADADGTADPSDETVPYKRIALELVLPAGRHLVLLGRTPKAGDGGLLTIEIEPAPVNPAALLEDLGRLADGRGTEEAPAVADPLSQPTRDNPIVELLGLRGEGNLDTTNKQPSTLPSAPACIGPSVETASKPGAASDPQGAFAHLSSSAVPAAPPPPLSAAIQSEAPDDASQDVPVAPPLRQPPVAPATGKDAASPGTGSAATASPTTGATPLMPGGKRAPTYKGVGEAEPTVEYAELEHGSMEPMVGIDFGARYARMAMWGPDLVPLGPRGGMIPSLVSIPGRGRTLIGWEAYDEEHAAWTIAAPRRLLGCADPGVELAGLLRGPSIITKRSDDGGVLFESHGTTYTPLELCSMVLGKLRGIASRELHAEVRRAVLTIAAGANKAECDALHEAAHEAGWEEIVLLPEATAAVLARADTLPSGRIAIYDLGSRFSCCVVDTTTPLPRLVCSGGDRSIGGDALDASLATLVAERMWPGSSTSDSRARWVRLLWAVDEAKQRLQNDASTTVKLDSQDAAECAITGADVAQLSRPLIERSLAVTVEVMAAAGLTPNNVRAVILTGGCSAMPEVQQAVTTLFHRKPLLEQPALSVVTGAAIHGAKLAQDVAKQLI